MPTKNTKEKTETVFTTETFKVKGEELLDKVKELVHQGNIHKIIIKDEKGHTFIEIPLTVGVVGAILLPIWAAVGALAALVAKFTIIVERKDKS